MVKTTELLFGSFPREMGGFPSPPFRRPVYSLQHFYSTIQYLNGISDVFVSVYDGKVIDKIFGDWDGNLEGVKKIYEELSKKTTVIPVFSGSKGIHLYVLTKPAPMTEENKLKLFVLSRKIFSNSGVDYHVVGDVSRLCRVPNTLHPKGLYCTYLPPDWTWMEWKDLIAHAKERHEYEYEIRRNLSLEDVCVEKKDVELVKGSIEKCHIRFLKSLLRPCILRHISTPNPSHTARVAMVIDLMWTGLTKNQIVDIISQLEWEDFDRAKTEYQVEQIFKKGYKPYSCRRLRELKIPEVCCLG